jgi:hypothetical protein
VKRITLLLTLSLVAATSAAAQARNVKGPNAVDPGSRVAFKGKGYKPGAETLARVSPVICPTGGESVNAIKNGKAQWKVKSSGKVRAEFRWPRTYTGSVGPMNPETYQWDAGEKVRVQICEFKGGFKCGSTYTRIKASN